MAERHPESDRDPRQQGGGAAQSAGGGALEKGESRRDFIKKLPYIAPAIQTFFLSETVYAKKSDDDSDDSRGRGRGRRRRISPVPKKKKKKKKKDK